MNPEIQPPKETIDLAEQVRHKLKYVLELENLITDLQEKNAKTTTEQLKIADEGVANPNVNTTPVSTPDTINSNTLITIPLEIEVNGESLKLNGNKVESICERNNSWGVEVLTFKCNHTVNIADNPAYRNLSIFLENAIAVAQKEKEYSKELEGRLIEDSANRAKILRLEEEMDRKSSQNAGRQWSKHPGGDIVTMKCDDCGHTWKMELPQ